MEYPNFQFLNPTVNYQTQGFGPSRYNLPSNLQDRVYQILFRKLLDQKLEKYSCIQLVLSYQYMPDALF